jgi:hypothetical protein
MDSDHLMDTLRATEVPGTAEARGRAIAAARLAYRAHPATSRSRSGRLAVALVSIALLGALSLTPPGEAATGWVGRLVGIGGGGGRIGHIGGPPSVLTRFGLAPAPEPQVVIADGAAPDGNRYQLSAFESHRHGTCFMLSFPRLGPQHGTGQCTENRLQHALNDFSVANDNGFGRSNYTSNDRAWTTPALAIVGANVARMRVAPDRRAEQIAGVRIVSLNGALQRRIGAPRPLKVALFFLVHPAATVARFEATAYDRRGREVAHSRKGAPRP